MVEYDIPFMPIVEDLHLVSFTAADDARCLDVVEILKCLIREANLAINLIPSVTDQKLSQKELRRLKESYPDPLLIIDKKGDVSLLSSGIRVAPNWQSMQQRVVRAGRKSELLLQATKVKAGSRVLDATAGFGHDSLILASTGAEVTLLERHSIMSLLLMYEQVMMSRQKNWQKLMARLNIKGIDAMAYLAAIDTAESNVNGYDLIYLDPMFPENSYSHEQSGKGAKVGKHMQVLHTLASPPDISEEVRLLNLALANITATGRVVVKRPVTAPILGDRSADESWQNDVVRFDAYF